MKCERCGSPLFNMNPTYIEYVRGHKYIKCSHCKQWHKEVLAYTIEKCDVPIKG